MSEPHRLICSVIFEHFYTIGRTNMNGYKKNLTDLL